MFLSFSFEAVYSVRVVWKDCCYRVECQSHRTENAQQHLPNNAGTNKEPTKAFSSPDSCPLAFGKTAPERAELELGAILQELAQFEEYKPAHLKSLLKVMHLRDLSISAICAGLLSEPKGQLANQKVTITVHIKVGRCDFRFLPLSSACGRCSCARSVAASVLRSGYLCRSSFRTNK